MHLKWKGWKGFWRKQRLQKCPNGQVTTIFARSPKPAFSEKVQRGDQVKFFKNHPESSPRLKGPKALRRKRHYPVISMHLRGKDCRIFWRKQRFQKYPNNQVMAIFARSPKSRIFWKSANGGPWEIFQKSSKKMPYLKGPKSTVAQMALTFN